MDGQHATAYATESDHTELPARSPWSHWLAHFERQRHRPVPRVDGELSLSLATLRVLGASLARFQLGETGEGRIVREIERFHAINVDDSYRRALELFVREEGRHARILREALIALGVPVLEHDWTARWFRRSRQLCGVRFKLLVLLAAEIVAIVAYGALAAHLPASNLRAAIEQLRSDEEHHLAFHGDFFRLTSSSALARGGFALALSLLVPAALLVVLLDHRHTWRALEASRSALWKHACVRTLQSIRYVLTPTCIEAFSGRRDVSHGCLDQYSMLSCLNDVPHGCLPRGQREPQ